MHATAGAGALLGVAAVWLKARDASHPVPDVVLTGLSGFLFLGAGVFARRRRPDNNTGPLLVAVGVAMFVEDVQFSRTPVLFTTGVLLAHASSPFVVHLVLAFPRGVLGTRPARALAAAAYADVFVLAPLATMVAGPRPNFLATIAHQPSLSHLLDSAVNAVGAVIATGVAVVLWHRWRTGTAKTRRLLLPVLVIGLVGAVASALAGAIRSQHADYPALITLYKVAFCLWPAAFVVGVLRAGPGQAAVAELLVALREPRSPAELRDLLARTLRDRSLRLWLWHPPSGGFRDVDGTPVDPCGAVGAVTFVEHRGRRVAALVGRTTSWEDPRVLAAIGAVTGLVADEQVRAEEERTRLAELRASRARLVALADAERQRVERDLHDGAQQRLVAVALGLRLAQQRLEHDSDGGSGSELAALLSASVDGVEAAMAELRDLARGIHPAVLTQAGLVPAVAALLERTPLPAELSATAVPRLAPAVEAGGYFVVAEAVTNALKHARAERLRVDVRLDDGVLRVRVEDDGVGGAAVGTGSGLSGLRDRVHAAGGELVVTSAAGGTTVEAAIPLAGARG